MISQLGEIIGHAITALDRTEALVADGVTEFDVRIPGVVDGIPAEATGAEPTSRFDRTIPADCGGYILYVSASDVSERGLGAILDVHGGYGAIREPPGNGDATLRQVIDAIERTYPGVEFVGQRNVERGDPSDVEYVGPVRRSLTDRQLQVIEAAYFTGVLRVAAPEFRRRRRRGAWHLERHALPAPPRRPPEARGGALRRGGRPLTETGIARRRRLEPVAFGIVTPICTRNDRGAM